MERSQRSDAQGAAVAVEAAGAAGSSVSTAIALPVGGVTCVPVAAQHHRSGASSGAKDGSVRQGSLVECRAARKRDAGVAGAASGEFGWVDVPEPVAACPATAQTSAQLQRQKDTHGLASDIVIAKEDIWTLPFDDAVSGLSEWLLPASATDPHATAQRASRVTTQHARVCLTATHLHGLDKYWNALPGANGDVLCQQMLNALVRCRVCAPGTALPRLPGSGHAAASYLRALRPACDADANLAARTFMCLATTVPLTMLRDSKRGGQCQHRYCFTCQRWSSQREKFKSSNHGVQLPTCDSCKSRFEDYVWNCRDAQVDPIANAELGRAKPRFQRMLLFGANPRAVKRNRTSRKRACSGTGAPNSAHGQRGSHEQGRQVRMRRDPSPSANEPTHSLSNGSCAAGGLAGIAVHKGVAAVCAIMRIRRNGPPAAVCSIVRRRADAFCRVTYANVPCQAAAAARYSLSPRALLLGHSLTRWFIASHVRACYKACTASERQHTQHMPSVIAWGVMMITPARHEPCDIARVAVAPVP